MAFKSDCDFNDFDKKRADFIYQNAIDLWKSLETSIQCIKRNAVVLLSYLLGSSSLLINLFFNPNAKEYKLAIIMCILIHLLISAYITLTIFYPKDITLPFLSPEDLLSWHFNYDKDNKLIELSQWKLKILQDIIDTYIDNAEKLRISLVKVIKNSIFYTIIAPFISMAINDYDLIMILCYYLSPLFCCFS